MSSQQLRPVYLPENCSPAYQLNWSLSVFGKDQLASPEPSIITQLNEALDGDGIRILECNNSHNNAVNFLLSTKPKLSPADIIRLTKGRWQYAMRKSSPISFRRNYQIVSVGSANCETLEAYTAKQPAKHPMGSSNAQAMIDALQYSNDNINLQTIRLSSHGRFVYCLQLVFEIATESIVVHEGCLRGYRDMIIACGRKHRWLIRSVGMLYNHMHVLLAANITESPETIALRLMNNLSSTQKMTPVLKYSYYVGTFGPYDLGAIWNRLAIDQ